MTAFTLNLNPFIQLTDEQFFQLCQQHELIVFERNPDRTLVLMPLRGALTSNRNLILSAQLCEWNRDDRAGIAFGSCTGFTLPNGAVRAPNAAWVRREKWDALMPEEREKFAPVCPDFVVELRSQDDCWQRLRKKMQEYRDNGAKLGWLIDLKSRQVEIYRPGQAVEELENPAILSGETVLPGFVLKLDSIWFDKTD